MKLQPTEFTPSNRLEIAIVVTAVLAVFAAIGNTVVTFFLWDSNSEPITCFGCGMLIAQPCLLSIWCALVKQRVVLRISLSMGILFGLYGLYMITLNSMGDDMPLEVPLVCFGVTAGLTLLIQMPLYLIRRMTGVAIAIGDQDTSSRRDDQFGIKHLMVVTTIAAILVAIAQAVFPHLELEGGAPWGEIIGFLVTFMVLASLIVWMSVSAVFFDRIRIAAGIVLLIVNLAGPFAVHNILFQVFSGIPNKLFFNTMMFSIALTGTILTVLTIFYAVGYRVRYFKAQVS